MPLRCAVCQARLIVIRDRHGTHTVGHRNGCQQESESEPRTGSPNLRRLRGSETPERRC